MDPNDWQRYNKRRPQSRSGGMGFGIGGSSGSGNLGIADYLTENFDNLGGGSLTPQQELAATQKAIREGGAMKSPQTDVTRFITEAPDGSNYMDPKAAEIPPMLARQITDPTPPAPASGSGINPQMLVRPQGDAQSRGSNLANTMPRREDFRRREAMAAKMEASALEAQNSGFANFMAPDRVNAAVLQRMQGAQALRQQDEADYQASVNQYYIQNPDKFAEWQKRAVIQQGKPMRYQPTIATQRGTKDVVAVSDAGIPTTIPGVSETQLESNEMIAQRQKELAELRAQQETVEHERRMELDAQQHGNRMGEIGKRNEGTAPKGGKPAVAKPANASQLNAALRQGKPGTPKYDAAMQQMGLTKRPDGSWWNEATGVSEVAPSNGGATGSRAAPSGAPVKKKMTWGPNGELVEAK